MSKPRRIFVATGIYPPQSGGPATYAKFLYDKLPVRGYEVAVLPYREVRRWPKVLRHAAYFGKCLAGAWRADLVYALDTVSVGLPAALAATALGKPFMLRVPGDYAWEQGMQRFGVVDELNDFQHKRYGWQVELLRRAQRFVAARARAIVVPSDYMKKIVSGWTNPAKVHRIYTSIALPPEFVLPADRPDGFVVLSIARPVPWKGLDALKRVVERERGWVFKHVDGLPHAQAMGWIKAADVFVLNSTYEGLSHLLVEALSLGTPVVATNVGGNPEVVGDAGLLVPPHDDEALYQALRSVADDRVGASERAARGLVRVKQFDIESALGQLTTLIDTVCAS